jgi:ferric-dicitrate binding protein FerR (iron transport regulator)
MTHEEALDLLAPGALGTLSRTERVALEAHLSSCTICPTVLTDFRTIALALPLSIPPQEPSPWVKARLMNQIQTPPRTAWLRPLAMAAALLACAGLNWMWVQRRVASWEVAGLTGTLQADGRDVRAGGRIRPGQRLATGEGGQADIRLASRAVLRLKAHSEAVIEREQKGFLVRLAKGGLLSQVKTGTPFSVQTPLAAAAVRGTVFYIQTDAPNHTYACICSGRFHLEAAGFSEDREAEHHQALVLTARDGKVRTAPGALIGHSDDDVQALQALQPGSFKSP